MGIDAVVVVRFLLTGVALLLAFLAAVTWNRRKEAPEATVFAVLLASMALYAFGYAGEVAQTNVAAAVNWLHVEYLALPWAGGLWVWAACLHNRRRIVPWLLFVIPAITLVGHFTNVHNLFYRSAMTLVQRGPFQELQFDRGPLSLLDNAYLMVCFLAGSWLYLSGYRHASPLFRKQAGIMVLGSLMPFLGYYAYLVGLSPWGLDITPITLGITCGLLYYAIFHCGVFDLAPQARSLIFNTMRDGVLVLDTRDRLLDFNPAAAAFLPALNRKSVGMEVAEILKGTPGLAVALSGENGLTEFAFTTVAGTQSFEIRTWPLYADSLLYGPGRLGRAVLFADVSAQVRLREELRRRSETDSLTGVANRRRFQQALEIECIRFTRGRAPLSVLMVDLDHFKEVNDRHGHPVGDAVLKAIAQRLLVSLRKTDLLARFGGEEFAVLLPETRGEGAGVIAERIRLSVCQTPVEVEGIAIPITASVGVASHATDAEVDSAILLKKADLALYRAKAAGRNRVEAA